MSQQRTSSLTRRGVLAGAGAATLGSLLGLRQSAGQSTDNPELELCLDDPDVSMLVNWTDGLLRYAGLLDPPVGWELVTNFDVDLILIIPGDWDVQVGFADTFSRSLAPELHPTPRPISNLSLYRLLSADTRTAFDRGNGFFDSITINSALDLSPIARQAVLGENPDTTPICAAQIYRPYPQTSTWITAETTRSHLLVTIGEVLHDYSTSGLITGFSYGAYYAPRDEFQDAVIEYYYRFMYQEMQKAGGGGDDPTPTPTPLF